MSLRIDISFPAVRIKSQLPQALIKRQDPQLKVQTEGPEIKIEQKKPLAEIGMGDLNALTDKVVIESQETYLKGLVRVAQEGDRLASELSKDTIATLAKEKVRAKPFEKEIVVDIAPKSRPAIFFHYETEVDFELGYVKVDFDLKPPQINFLSGRVDITYIKGSQLDRRG